jgi:hypothetical protein
MPKTRNSLQLTRNETIERLQAAKSYLGNKDRLAFMRTGSIYLPCNYRPEDEQSWYSAPRLSELELCSLSECTMTFAGHNWKADSRFMASNAIEFTDWAFRKGASIGEAIVIIFYPWKEKRKTAKTATLWLGTWHHAPLIAWIGGMVADQNVTVDALPKYLDLIH